MRNVTTRSLSMSLLLVLLLLTALYSTAQAGREGLFRNLERFRSRHKRVTEAHLPLSVDRHGNHSIPTSSGAPYCSSSSSTADAISIAEAELSAPSLFKYRGGYSDGEVVTSPSGIDQEDSSSGSIPAGRLDVVAKAKSYGKLEFSLFQKGDGSDKDPDGIPTRYMAMQLQRRDKAKKAAHATLVWRNERNIDSILKRPHPDFDVAKAVFPHYFVARDVGGHVVFIQRPALLNLKLAAKNGLNNRALLDHYIYVNEYLWQIVESKNALATMTGIMDMQGLNLGMIRKADIMNFLKEFVKTMDSHYPQRAHKTLIVNAPKWFNLLYKIVSPILRESTKSRIEIHARGKRQDKALYSFLGKDAEKLLPASFFSKKRDKRDKSNRKNGDDDDDADENGDEDPQLSQEVPVMSQLESDLRSFTLARLKEAGVKMQKVVPV